MTRFGPYPKIKQNGKAPDEVLVPVLRGEKGDKGDRGEMGTPIIGPQGEKGDTGEAGLSGLDGLDGREGPRGITGPIGPRGPVGFTGKDGQVGLTGPQGDKGDTGKPGRDGIPGTTGKDGFQGSGVGGGPVGVNVTGTTGRTKELEITGSGAPTVTYAKGTKKTTLTFASGGVTDADYLVGTTQSGLSAEIVVGTSPGGELGGTWATPTVDASHSGSTHAATQAAAESTAAGAAATHAAAADPHTGYQKESELNAASGYAGLSSASRVTKGVDTTDDLIVDSATTGLVIKDTQGSPHYWRLSVTTLGVLVTTDLGTSKP